MINAPYVCLLLIIVVSTLINVVTLEKGHYWGDDFALYIAQAKSLVEGNPDIVSSQNTFAMSHSSYPIGPNLVPWGFPILLSPIYAIYGLDLIVLKIPGLILFELSLIVMFFIFFRKLDTLLTLLLVASFALNPFFILLNDNINSDTSYLFFSLLTILAIQKNVVEKDPSDYTVISFFMIGFLIFLSYSMRIVGTNLIILLVQVYLIKIIRTHGRNFIRYILTDQFFWLPLIVFSIFQTFIDILLPSGTNSYFLYLPPINLTSIKRQIYYYFTIPSEFFKPYFPSLIYVSTIPFALLGFKNNFNINYLYLIYSFITFSILVIIPYPGGLRYMLPILPFYIYFFCVGLYNSLKCFSIPLFRSTFSFSLSYIFMISIVCLLASHSIWVASIVYDKNYVVDGPFTEVSLEMFNFIVNYTKKTDIIVFFKPRVLRLLTGRQSIMLTSFSQLTESGSHYLVIRKSKGSDDIIPPGYDQISPYSKEFSQISETCPLAFENTDFLIFDVKGLQKLGDH
jgi:hypothetical protein